MPTSGGCACNKLENLRTIFGFPIAQFLEATLRLPVVDHYGSAVVLVFGLKTVKSVVPEFLSRVYLFGQLKEPRPFQVPSPIH